MNIKWKRKFICGILFLLLAFLYGCSKDGGAVTVDFEKTISINRPETNVSKNTSLNVAVAAMISPKETFSFYRKLLDFIGEKVNRKVSLIQRKTYGEVNDLFKMDKSTWPSYAQDPTLLRRKNMVLKHWQHPLFVISLSTNLT